MWVSQGYRTRYGQACSGVLVMRGQTFFVLSHAISPPSSLQMSPEDALYLFNEHRKDNGLGQDFPTTRHYLRGRDILIKACDDKSCYLSSNWLPQTFIKSASAIDS
jgi:hypothetical protein